ncbi:cell division protein [Mariniflexile ostreae]|uniref:Cell division protein n=1 Tax=Mariniflexile ostreae TaxID=1520892 RepID=A0ABV5FAI5_9FLAO
MPVIEIQTEINSNIKTCFDLARDIEVHQESLKISGEKAIAGKISGLIEYGEWVSWEAQHLGFVQHFTSKITKFEPPTCFVGEMVLGVFKSFRHEHVFLEKDSNRTLMIDKYYFEPPYGVLGKVANLLFIKRYMKKILKMRSDFLKHKAETLQ